MFEKLFCFRRIELHRIFDTFLATELEMNYIATSEYKLQDFSFELTFNFSLKATPRRIFCDVSQKNNFLRKISLDHWERKFSKDLYDLNTKKCHWIISFLVAIFHCNELELIILLLFLLVLWIFSYLNKIFLWQRSKKLW